MTPPGSWQASLIGPFSPTETGGESRVVFLLAGNCGSFTRMIIPFNEHRIILVTGQLAHYLVYWVSGFRISFFRVP